MLGVDDLPVVKIIWCDAARREGLNKNEIQSKNQTFIYTTIGWLVKETSEEIFVASDYGENAEFDGTAIPAAWIIERVVVNGKNRKS